MEDFTVSQIIEYMLEGKPIPEHEIRCLCYEYYPCDDPNLVVAARIEEEDRRWSRCVKIIFKVNGERYFRIYYDKGLTECQEDYFEEQVAVEVEPKTRTIVETYWEKKEK